MHTAEEVRELANCTQPFDYKIAQMLLAYADLLEALKQAHDAMEAFTDPEGNMPERTGEFNDLKKALHATSAALAATRKEEGNG